MVQVVFVLFAAAGVSAGEHCGGDVEDGEREIEEDENHGGEMNGERVDEVCQAGSPRGSLRDGIVILAVVVFLWFEEASKREEEEAVASLPSLPAGDEMLDGGLEGFDGGCTGERWWCLIYF